MNIRRKKCDIRTWKNIYFLTYPPSTLIHLSHRFISASKPATQKSFGCCLSHFCTSFSNSSSSAKHLPPSYEPLYVTNISHHTQEIFLSVYPLHWVLLPTKKLTTECCSSVVHPSSMVAILTSETSL
jgi:hypothetical protein